MLALVSGFVSDVRTRSVDWRLPFFVFFVSFRVILLCPPTFLFIFFKCQIKTKLFTIFPDRWTCFGFVSNWISLQSQWICMFYAKYDLWALTNPDVWGTRAKLRITNLFMVVQHCNTNHSIALWTFFWMFFGLNSIRPGVRPLSLKNSQVPLGGSWSLTFVFVILRPNASSDHFNYKNKIVERFKGYRTV